MARDMNRRACRFAPAAMEMLVDYAWPGNVRELENAIERAVVLQQGEEIGPDDLPIKKPAPAAPAADSLSLAEVEKRHVQGVLWQMGGNISKAARALEIDRVTLYNKIRKYGLNQGRE